MGLVSTPCRRLGFIQLINKFSCEPACGYTYNLSPGAKGPVKSCNKSNGLAASGAQNACFANSGQLAFSCSAYQPIIVNSTFSYGFAGFGNTATNTCTFATLACKNSHPTVSMLGCKCYHFTWTSGAGKGKSMIVQAINAGGITDVDFDIYTPGGGVGDYNGCIAQYGAPQDGWGARYGGSSAILTIMVCGFLRLRLGVSSDAECNALPSELRAGCHWRWKWAGGSINEW
jgi:hypothetical protein